MGLDGLKKFLNFGEAFRFVDWILHFCKNEWYTKVLVLYIDFMIVLVIVNRL